LLLIGERRVAADDVDVVNLVDVAVVSRAVLSPGFVMFDAALFFSG